MGDKERNGEFGANMPWPVVLLLLWVCFPVGLFFLFMKSRAGGGNREKQRKQKKSVFASGLGMLCLGLFIGARGGGFGLWLTIGGIIAALSGAFKTKSESRYKHYMAVIGDKTQMPVSAIAAALSVSYESACDDLQKMIDGGWFGANKPYLDHNARLFVLDRRYAPDITPVEAYEPAPKAEAKAAPQPARAQEAAARPTPNAPKSEYLQKIEEIRRVNEAIKDQKVSEQIDRIEEVTASIFDTVSEHPDKKNQINTFMNYYLPTTLKLLKQYAQLERQTVQGANIVESKRRIEKMMDQLVWAFEQQLDKMYESEALDISTDITVLEKMIAKDGLSGSELKMPTARSAQGGAAAATATLPAGERE